MSEMAQHQAGRSTESGRSTADQTAARVTAGAGIATKLVDILRKRWPIVLLIAVACAASAYVADRKFTQWAWSIRGTMLYQPISSQEDQRVLYPPPSLQVFEKEVIKSPQTLTALAEEFDLKVPPEAMSKWFKIEIPDNTELLTIKLEWEEKETGVALVDRLMQMLIANAAKMRKQKLKDDIDSRQSALEDCKKSMDDAQRECNRVLRAAALPDAKDLKAQMESMGKEIELQEIVAATARNEQRVLEPMIAKWNEAIKTLRAIPKESPIPEPADCTSDPSYQEKKRNLKEKLEVEEQKLTLMIDRFDKANKNCNDLQREYNKGTIARKVYEEADREVKTVRIERNNAERSVTLYKQDLRDLPIEQYRIRKNELEKRREANLQTIEQTRLLIESKKQRATQLAGIYREVEPFDKKTKELDTDRLQLEKQITVLRQLRDSNASEFKVLVPSSHESNPFSPNRKKLWLFAGIAPFVVLVGLLIGVDLLMQSGRVEDLARRLNLPMLAKARAVRGGGAKLDPDEARSLALRLRQYMSENGGVILLTPLNEGSAADELVRDISGYLAMRDERILIVDARIANDQEHCLPAWIERPAPVEISGAGNPSFATSMDSVDPSAAGLVQYLIFEGQNSNQYIWPTQRPGVDFLPSGGPYSLTDVLASQSMNDLLEHCAKTYTLILLLGPAFSCTIDTEILAAYANGIILVLNRPIERFSPELGKFYGSLQEAQAPFLGAVVWD